VLIQALQVAIVAWLPGAVVYRVPFAGRESRAAIAPEERLFWAVVLSVCWSLACVLALAFFGAYTFARLLTVNVVMALGVAIVSRFDLRLRPRRRWPGVSALLLLPILALGISRFFPPAEFVVGGRDPGVYMNAGIQIAQRGTFLYEDPVVRSVPAFARDLFFPSHQRHDYYGVRFMGFHIIDPDRGLVVAQFPHLFPASIAIGYGIDGLTGARRTPGVWAILGLLSVYFLGSRLFGRAPAYAAALLLALHLVQVWFARYPSTEVVMQALLFAALLALVRSQDGDRFFSIAAGVLLGLMLFLRVDAVLAIAGVVAGLGLLFVTDARWRLTFLAPLAVLVALAAAYLLGPMRHYSDRALVFAINLRSWQYGMLLLAAVGATALVVVSARRPAIRARVRVFAPRVLSIALIAAAIYAMYFRRPGGRLAAHDAFALRTVTEYYLTLPAVAAALIGYALAARRTFWSAPAFFTTVALYCFFFFYKIYIVPEHFWMSRRYLPLILPAACLLAAVAALGTRQGPSFVRPLRWIIGIVFLVLLGRQYARVSEPILGHVEFAGVIPRLEGIASTIRDTDLLIVESGDAGTDVHTLALPLAYIYARSVLVLSSAAPDKLAFEAFLTWAREHYARVLFLGAGGTDLLSPAWDARVVATDRFRVPEYVAGPGEFPRHPRAKQFDYTVYEFTDPDPGSSASGRDVTIDLGLRDDLNVLRFHAKEETEGRTFRWSQDDSYVIVPQLNAGVRVVTLWMSDGGRPDAAPPARVTLFLDEQEIGSADVDTGFKPYEFTIPAALAARAAARKAPIRLKLVTPVWSPERVLGTSDDRELGVMVDRLTVQ
jgi:hypothetical protein